jgi:hypothetical protein
MQRDQKDPNVGQSFETCGIGGLAEDRSDAAMFTEAIHSDEKSPTRTNGFLNWEFGIVGG